MTYRLTASCLPSLSLPCSSALPGGAGEGQGAQGAGLVEDVSSSHAAPTSGRAVAAGPASGPAAGCGPSRPSGSQAVKREKEGGSGSEGGQERSTKRRRMTDAPTSAVRPTSTSDGPTGTHNGDVGARPPDQILERVRGGGDLGWRGGFGG